MRKNLIAVTLLLALGSTAALAETSPATKTVITEQVQISPQKASKGEYEQHKKQRKNDDCKRDGKRDKTRHGGFIDKDMPITTSQQIDTLQDEQRVLLEGFIVKQTGKEEYLFKDATGELTVEIKHRAWAGQEVSNQDKVKLMGSVEKSWGKTEIEIHRVQKIAPENTVS